MQLGIPVHQAFVTINQAFLAQGYKDPSDGGRQTLIHSEAFALPVAGCTKTTKLTDDRATGLGFPLPDTIHESIAAKVMAGLAVLGKLSLNDHLGGDTGVISARLPKNIPTAQAFEPRQYILQGIVERMAHVQAAGHVRRRYNDGIRGVCRLCAAGMPAPERSVFFPLCVNPRLDGVGLIGLLHRCPKDNLTPGAPMCRQFVTLSKLAATCSNSRT